MNGDGWEYHWHSPCLHHAAFNRLNHLWHIAMARIEIAKSICDSNNWPIKSVVTKSHCLDKGFAQEQGEFGITIAG